MERNVAPTAPDLASLDCWDYTIELECLRGPQDLQLAAELGKTLLERNKELETSLRQQQNVVEDRDQEIEYLTKQTAALREVNDSRLRIYEQLEISIQDLERNNQRLVQESANDKKHIKSLYETIDSLESRCEDLQRLVDDMGRSAEKDDGAVGEDGAGGGGGGRAVDDQDDWRRLVTQLEHAKNQRAKEQRKVSELEQNVSLLVQENTSLEEKVCVMQRKDEELKTLQDQIVYLEEIRQGNLCRRCQRSTDPNLFDECSVYDDDDDTDDISAIGSYVETHKHEVLQQLQETLGENYSEDNPYRILVDKYEALLKIQQKHNAFTGTCATPPSTKDNQNHGISLHEELQMSGQFSSFNGNASEDSNDDDDDPVVAVTGKRSAGGENEAAAAAQCKYSETDTTSSSGFSDETSNKCTQTAETSFFAGSFLCTISDGDDCRFSIYDDASPVESRFRKTPEYRHLFREIFAVLKRAAEAKDEGERLPLLQDDGDETCGRDPPPPPALPKVPPTTPAGEHDPLSFARADERCPATASAHEDEDEPGQTPRRRRDIIDELASAVKHKKHARHRKPASRQQSRDISHLMDFKWSDQEVVTRRPRNRAGDDDRPTTTASCHGAAAAWCAPADGGEDAATPYASSASQEVAKLKLLEKSYAEVLRLTKPPSNRPQSQYFNRT